MLRLKQDSNRQFDNLLGLIPGKRKTSAKNFLAIVEGRLFTFGPSPERCMKERWILPGENEAP